MQRNSPLRSGFAARHDHRYTRTNMRITKLTEPQLDEAAALLARAFFDRPVWTWVVPDETQRRTAMAWFMSAAVRSGMLGGEAYGAGAPLRGVAIWDRPSDGVDLDPDGTKSGFNEISSRMGEYAMARFAAMASAQRCPRTSDGRAAAYWYLSLLAADPASQRTASGRVAHRHVHAADAAGLPCMLRDVQRNERPVLRASRLRRRGRTGHSRSTVRASGSCAAIRARSDRGRRRTGVAHVVRSSTEHNREEYPFSSRLATSFAAFSKASSLLLPPSGVGLPGNKMTLFFREVGPEASEIEVGYLVVYQAEIVSGAGDGAGLQPPVRANPRPSAVILEPGTGLEPATLCLGIVWVAFLAAPDALRQFLPNNRSFWASDSGRAEHLIEVWILACRFVKPSDSVASGSV